jgi:hypothetical protein
VIAGVGIAAASYPGGYDWAYTVISRLASRRHNPAGGVWLSGLLLAGMALLWPAVRRLGSRDGVGAGRGWALLALRLGVVAGVLLGLEGLFAVDLARVGRKAHEALAIVALLGFYTGVLGLSAQRIRHAPGFPWPMVLVIVPILAIGASQLALYFDQRELGWVNTGWRELGVPLWLSFAFWQWLAVAFLGIALGWLCATPGPAPHLAGQPGGRHLATSPARNPAASVPSTPAPAPADP